MEPPARASGTSPPRTTAPFLTLPALTPDQDRLFEALAKGQTSPAELSATLNLPIRQVLTLLATPEITFHLEVLESAIDDLARHTTRLRQNLAFKSLESALTVAAAKENPAEIRRIATLLLKPTPPLPDPEAEHAERISKYRRDVDSPSLREGVGGRVPASPDTQSRATDRLSSSGRCSTQVASVPPAAPANPQPSDTRPGGGRQPGLLPPDAPAHSATQLTPTPPAAQSPSHRVGGTGSPSHASPQHSPAQPRAA